MHVDTYFARVVEEYNQYLYMYCALDKVLQQLMGSVLMRVVICAPCGVRVGVLTRGLLSLLKSLCPNSVTVVDSVCS